MLKKMLFPALSVWEAVRLIILLFLIYDAVSGVPFFRNETFLFFLLFGSGNLIVPAGALYLFFTKSSSPPLLLILAAAKILSLATALLGLLPTTIRFLAGLRAGQPSFQIFFQGVILFIIFLLDLIFLLLLLSFKEEGEGDEAKTPVL